MTMRVLQLLTQARGGPVDHAVEVAAELVRLGHDSHLVSPPGDHLAEAAAHGVSVHEATIRGTRDLVGAREVAAVVGRVRPDVLHLQDRRAGLFGRALSGRRAIPTVYTLHGVPDQLAHRVPGNLPVAPERVGDRARYLHLERLLAHTRRSVVVTPCQALADYAREHVRVPEDRVHSVPNGVGRRWLGRTRDGNDPTPRADGPVRVTWLGLMEPVKRVPDLVAAAGLVPDLHLELVGDGPERPRIAAAIDALADPTRVSLVGFRADPEPLLARTDIVAMPSAAEACPMAILQAMACGVPVVATRVGGVPEIVRDDVDGRLVDPGNVAQLAHELAALARDAGMRQRLGASARARVTDQFGIDRTTQSLLEVYEQVAS